jgi:hypothetical protein
MWPVQHGRRRTHRQHPPATAGTDRLEALVIDGYQRCVCGEVELPADGSTVELAGVKHRLDGPCYRCDRFGEPLEMTMHEVDVLPGMVIRPGDVLVVACDEVLSLSGGQVLHDALMERMPGLADVVVLSRPLSIAAVYRENDVDEGGPVL